MKSFWHFHFFVSKFCEARHPFRLFTVSTMLSKKLNLINNKKITGKILFLLTDIKIHRKKLNNCLLEIKSVHDEAKVFCFNILFENLFKHFIYIFPSCFSPICPVVLKSKIFILFAYSLKSPAQKCLNAFDAFIYDIRILVILELHLSVFSVYNRNDPLTRR
jgi:hypothetical protein